MNQEGIARAVADLDAWLETMRQPGGYGGPVAHWWQSRFHYTGPGLDWRYEGILIGYAQLFYATGDPRWRERLQAAADDLLVGQDGSGGYRASRFEINPGRLGTPHEAAASLGLLVALPLLNDPPRVLAAVRRNVDHLIKHLWDGTGFNDRAGTGGRVPNKLATLALALIHFTFASGKQEYLPYARGALEDIIRLQDKKCGAVHQYAPGVDRGDGRFFPFYNARCIPALKLGGELFSHRPYFDAAERIVAFLHETRDPAGGWPQVTYHRGQMARWPKWLAGSAEIVRVLAEEGEAAPEYEVERVLSAQLPSGGFETACGFGRQIHQRDVNSEIDYRDVLPVVGWNDKVLRLLAGLLRPGSVVPPPETRAVRTSVMISAVPGEYHETPDTMSISSATGDRFLWHKAEAWARVLSGRCRVR